jgi:hypothetical protein
MRGIFFFVSALTPCVDLIWSNEASSPCKSFPRMVQGVILEVSIGGQTIILQNIPFTDFSNDDESNDDVKICLHPQQLAPPIRENISGVPELPPSSYFTPNISPHSASILEESDYNHRYSRPRINFIGDRINS